jgi:hypothetical protein
MRQPTDGFRDQNYRAAFFAAPTASTTPGKRCVEGPGTSMTLFFRSSSAWSFCLMTETRNCSMGGGSVQLIGKYARHGSRNAA